MADWVSSVVSTDRKWRFSQREWRITDRGDRRYRKIIRKLVKYLLISPNPGRVDAKRGINVEVQQDQVPIAKILTEVEPLHSDLCKKVGKYSPATKFKFFCCIIEV